jgi:hypothetical protein
MSDPWKQVNTPDQVDIVAPDGVVRCRIPAYYSGNLFVVDDMTADIRPGDEIRRLLPNGNEEAFQVLDPKFFKASFFSAHYQIKISRPAVHSKHTGGNYNVHLSGANSRVNFGSVDQSTNISHSDDVFAQIKATLDSQISDVNDRETLKTILIEMKAAQNKEALGTSYQKFIASAANHMAIIAPFLPALGTLFQN